MCCFFDAKIRKHEFLNATSDRNYLERVFKKHKIAVVVDESNRAWITEGMQADWLHKSDTASTPRTVV
jgi:hypothetical protein